MKRSRPVIEINMTELRRALERARHAPMGEADYLQMQSALDVLEERIKSRRTTEKTRAVVEQPELADENGVAAESSEQQIKKGHGRNSAEAYTGERKVAVHAKLASGDACPECERGRVYKQREPKTLVRVVGQPPLEATVYEMERMRCNACGQVFTAETPKGIGEDKYDATAIAIIAQLKYGGGVPFTRLERMEEQMGVPLPAATQWELVEKGAAVLKPAFDQLIWQAAQGEVLHNDDTGMRILQLAREPSDKRTGTFTSGIVSLRQGHKIALFFTGRQHAGENLRDLLRKRAEEARSPIQMCDALSRNTPKPGNGIVILLANCLAHGRRQFVDVAANFPEECGYVLETLGMVYANDRMAREQGLDDEARLSFHRQYSEPLMTRLRNWLEEQLAQHKTEPNSGLGKAISYLLNHWRPLTLFLREAGAPLDNNICERALKKAILNRKNAMFYKTSNGAMVGDLYMSLIHTCELNGVNPFHYLTELQRHADEVKTAPGEWMPWNYIGSLEGIRSLAVA